MNFKHLVSLCIIPHFLQQNFSPHLKQVYLNSKPQTEQKYLLGYFEALAIVFSMLGFVSLTVKPFIFFTSAIIISSIVSLGLFFFLFGCKDLCFLFFLIVSENSSISVPFTTFVVFFLFLGIRSSSTLNKSSSAVSSSLIINYRRFLAMKLSCSKASSRWAWTRALVYSSTYFIL